MILFDEIYKRLCEPEGPGAQGNYLAWCPFHPDGKGKPPHRKSLSVHPERGFTCFACDEKGSIKKLAMKLGVTAESPPNSKIIDTYPYLDEQGNVLFEVVRLDPKNFRQRRPNGKGGWIWNVNGVRRVPFHLPELLAEPTRAAFVVEGEKDAESLERLGFLATTNPQGAGKWDKLDIEAVAKAFRGRAVCIIPDKDDPGRTHAREVARSLFGTAKEIRILELPGDGVKDASDWIAAGGGAESLNDLVRVTPPLTEPPVEDTDGHADAKRDEGEEGSSRLIGIEDLPEKPTPEALDAAMRVWRKSLTGKDPIYVSIAREAAIPGLGKLGVSTPAAIVDAALRGVVAQHATTDGGGGTLSFVDPEPWHEFVDGIVLLNELVDVLEKYLVLPKRAAQAIALWIVHCYVINAFEITPRLAVTSPEKRCGKTTLLKVLNAACPRPLAASSVTTSVVFRAIEKWQPTLIIDEADTFLKDNEELRGALNSGHCKDTAFILRSEGDNHEPRRFSTWGPVAIAKIGKLPGTLEDRSVEIEMRRKKKTERVSRSRVREIRAVLTPWCRKAKRWANDNFDALKKAEPKAPDCLDDRAVDNWEPLLAIADLTGGDWPRAAREAATTLSSARDSADGTNGVLLLRDFRSLLGSAGDGRVTTKAAIQSLVDLEDRPWTAFERGKPITPRQVSELLKPFGVASRTVRFDGVSCKGYVAEDFADAWSRYLDDPGPDLNGDPDGAGPQKNGVAATPPAARDPQDAVAALQPCKNRDEPATAEGPAEKAAVAGKHPSSQSRYAATASSRDAASVCAATARVGGDTTADASRPCHEDGSKEPSEGNGLFPGSSDGADGHPPGLSTAAGPPTLSPAETALQEADEYRRRRATLPPTRKPRKLRDQDPGWTLDPDEEVKG